MGRRPRHIIPGRLTELTVKTHQSRFLLKPTDEANRIIASSIARAQERHSLDLCSCIVMSNHIHLLCIPRSAEQIAGFMRDSKSWISQGLARLLDWQGGVFERQPYRDIPVSDEERAQTGRLRYTLSHGVKEGLVRRPEDWPGLNCVKALTDGSFEIRTQWFDREAYGKAQRAYERRGLRPLKEWKKPLHRDFYRPCAIVLTKIPCWAGLSDEAYCRHMESLLDSIRREYSTQTAHVASNAVKRIRSRSPRRRPKILERRPKPECHAVSEQARNEIRALRRAFLAAYRHASEQLRRGDPEAVKLFPPESFLPRQRLADALGGAEEAD